MITLVATLAGVALCLGLLLYILKDQQKLGQSVEREKNERKALDGVKEVVLVRDRLNTDDAYRVSVRERFTRK